MKPTYEINNEARRNIQLVNTTPTKMPSYKYKHACKLIKSFTNFGAMIDKEIFSLIEQERKRQVEGLELIASENFVSDQVLKAMGSELTNKYAEGLPGKRYYGGCEVVDLIENIAIDRLKQIFNLSWANVQPHSGAQANVAVCLACLKPGDKILGFSLDHGGHLSHGHPANFSGKYFHVLSYGVHKDTYCIDYESLEQTALAEKPKVIICGASAYSRDWDYKRLRKVADEIGALLWADIAHTAGLIAKGLLNDPFDWCHIISSTTHKTLRGPRGGIIMMRHDFPNPFGKKNRKGDLLMMSSLLNSAVFPGTQGGPLEHVIAAKAVSFKEVLDPSFDKYILQVKKNATVLSDSLQALGYDIITGGTDNHLMCVDLRKSNLSGKQVEEALQRVHITVNKNMIPFDERSAMVTSGIRIGSPALTTRGMKEEEMKKISVLIDQVLKNIDNNTELKKTAKEVKDFASSYPAFVSNPS